MAGAYLALPHGDPPPKSDRDGQGLARATGSVPITPRHDGATQERLPSQSGGNQCCFSHSPALTKHFAVGLPEIAFGSCSLQDGGVVTRDAVAGHDRETLASSPCLPSLHSPSRTKASKHLLETALVKIVMCAADRKKKDQKEVSVLPGLRKSMAPNSPIIVDVADCGSACLDDAGLEDPGFGAG